jgi:hypothetical protein
MNGMVDNYFHIFRNCKKSKLSNNIHILIQYLVLVGMGVDIPIVDLTNLFKRLLAHLQQLQSGLLQYLRVLQGCAFQQPVKHVMRFVAVLQLLHHTLPIIVLQQTLQLGAYLKRHVNLIPILTHPHPFFVEHFLHPILLILPEQTRNSIEAALRRLLCVLQKYVLDHCPVLWPFLCTLKAQGRANEVLQSLNLQEIKCILERFKSQELFKSRPNNFLIQFLGLFKAYGIRHFNALKNVDCWISPEQKTDDEQSEVSGLEFESIQLSTFQGLLVQEHGDFEELLLLDVPPEFEEGVANERKII